MFITEYLKKDKIKNDKVKLYQEVTEQVMQDDGIIVKKTKIVEWQPPKEYLNANDYRLDSILLAGATNLLQPTGMLSTSKFDKVDNLSRAADVLGKQIDLEQINNTVQENTETVEQNNNN